jgi:predicted RNase H-like HicB family nuclease
MIKFAVTLEQDEDGFWVAECPALPGCVSQGSTKAEALANISEAIAASLETRAAQGISPPRPVEVVEVEVPSGAQ